MPVKENTFALLQECCIGYAFWSLVHGLGPMIWFYPLNELDITGYEIFVLVAFSPILFVCGGEVNEMLRSFGVVTLLLALMLGGCASFHAPSTLYRLVGLSIGVAAAFLMQAATWWYADRVQRKIVFWGQTLGFLALLSSRIWYFSMTPMWNDHLTNKIIVSFLSIIVGLRILHNPSSVKHLPPTKATVGISTKKENSRGGSDFIASLGYGATFFILHAIFGEVSIVSRLTVKGFPNTGPMPSPWGGLILFMLTCGLVLSMHTNLAQNWLWSLVGFSSSMGLMFLQRWNAFACGALLALYIGSVWPQVGEHLVNCSNPGKSLVIGNAVYLLGVFGMVWCTAYNFVPFGGELARERTYVIVGMMMILVALSVTRKSDGEKTLRLSLSLPEVRYYALGTQPQTHQPQNEEASNFGKSVKNILFTIALLGLLGFEYRNAVWPSYNRLPVTENKQVENKEFSALIWTFHFGYDNRGWPSLERAAKLLNDTEADVITLLESDASKPYLGNNDIAMWLGERLGMYVDFGPSTRDHTWGNLLLSKHPIVRSEHHLLPSPHGELAPAISATINISGNPVDFVVTHMGNDRDNLDRRLQAKELSRLCDEAKNPVVFLGYVTSSPGSRDYAQLTTDGRMKDIDATDQGRWCEYIMYRGLTRLGYARISHGGLSDTELQMARWRIPKSGQDPKDNNNMTTFDEGVPSSILFNSVFGSLHYGHYYGVTNHFHMGTPKYFLP